MTGHGVALWNEFVAGGVRGAGRLADLLGEQLLAALERNQAADRLAEGAHVAFSLATQSLLMGAEPIGRLALAIEHLASAVLSGQVVAEIAAPFLASGSHTLMQALDALANPDRSGARVEGLPLEAARYELETLLPLPGQAPPPGLVPSTSLVRSPPSQSDPVSDARSQSVSEPGSEPEPRSGSGSGSGSEIWVPTVDDDMVDLFFAEVQERLEGLAVKLVEIEGRPDDPELVRDVFRDLHTLKGSSAMVGLRPMNDLAHAAEDLVGQVQSGQRRADRPVIDALLAALDELREVAARAGARQPIGLRADLVQRLRDPASSSPSPSPASDPAASDRAVEPAATPASQAAALAAPPVISRQDIRQVIVRGDPGGARQTIRVDFDKLDHLLNLVGELVLGRDNLRVSISSLSSLGHQLSSDLQLARRLELIAGSRQTRMAAGARLAAPRPAGPRARAALAELREELGRVERVLGDIAHELDHSSGRLDSVSGELRQAVMRLRMVPVGGVLRKHHRTVRDLANGLGKRARVVLSGEDTELDKLLVEALDEPLLHLVRNAVDHGLELPAERAAAGKPPDGTVTIRANQRGNQVIIQVSDDGRGISPVVVRRKAREKSLLPEAELAAMGDEEVLDLIFRPGFSTAAAVTDVSGRGVGMDVVRQTIVHQLKGTITIQSEVGAGSNFTLMLPLTLAITQVLLARASGEVFAVPLDNVVRTLTAEPRDIRLVQNRQVLAVRDRQVPLIWLADVLELQVEATDHAWGPAEQGEVFVILTEHGGAPFGLVCEALLGKKEIVIKSLGDILRGVPCAAGATLLGDRTALILDVAQVIERALAQRRTGGPGPASLAPAASAASARLATLGRHILLVEDSDMVRESLRRLLAEAGYRVTTARDGVEGLELARSQRFDLVSTDVMMPRMDGYELTRALRATTEYRDAPIVMVTSRGERIDRVRGFDAGVDEYITKPHDRHLLLKAVARLLEGASAGPLRGNPAPDGGDQ